MDLRQGVRIVVVPQSGGAPRTIELSPLRARIALWGLAAIATVLIVLLVSWGMVASRAARTFGLEEEVARLETQLLEVDALAARLGEVEAQYGRIQELFGSGVASGDDLWLPFDEAGAAADLPADSADSGPVVWPLTERGFITRSLLDPETADGVEVEHPGVDIAVAEGSYIRAAGRGRVAETGTDPVYGRFLLIAHPGGAETLYAHASMILASAGQEVRAGEVIGMTGSTGRSTAPHLHFEVRVGGVSVDPLTIVDRP